MTDFVAQRSMAHAETPESELRLGGDLPSGLIPRLSRRFALTAFQAGIFIMKSRFSTSTSSRRAWVPTSAMLAALLSACGGGGGGAPPPGSSANAYFESLNGDYVVQSSSIDLDNGYFIPFPMGLDSTMLRITLFAVAPVEGGQNGSAGVYSLQAPDVDFRSLAHPAPIGSAIGVARDLVPDRTFEIGGIHYFAGADVTVELSPTLFDDLSATAFLSDGFAKRFAFRIFAGNQKAVEYENSNGIDDDGDNLIDEADEDDARDVIAASATPVSEGRLTLSFRR